MTNTQTFTIRRSEERGGANHGWLNTKHSFSFARYFDPAHMGFRSLRVINQDIIAAGGGFPTHPHDNMEIFSYILRGTLAHKDSLNNSRALKPGMIQMMSTGTGVEHSEYNPSDSEEAEILQIWIKPSKQNLTPSYTEWEPNEEQSKQAKMLIISEDGRQNSATIHQDAAIYKLQIKAGESVDHTLQSGRGLWIQLISGSLEIGEHELKPGDAINTEDAGDIIINSRDGAEAILFDLK